MTPPTAESAAPASDSEAGIKIALDVLLALSEQSRDGRLRDAIGQVRSALWDELDRPGAPDGSGSRSP